MKITKYGFITAIGFFTFGSIIKKWDWELFSIVCLSIIIQSVLCKDCTSTFQMSAYISVLPILFLFLKDCNRIKQILVAFAVSLAIGRIGCYYAGCCSGRECKKTNLLKIKYEKDSVVNKQLQKDKVYVYPTILLEIIFQFAIAYYVAISKNGIPLFGLLNLMLYTMTNTWRLQERMSGSAHIPIMGLALFTIFSFQKCNGLEKYSFSYEFNYFNLIPAIIVAIIVSNDINVNSINKFASKEKHLDHN